MKLIEIEWVDSTSSTGWEHDTDLELSTCKTVGYMTRKTKDKIVLAQSVSDSGNVGNKFAISKGCITAIKELKS